jgi:MtN3 and saliva related transmembrane protein
MTVSDVLGVGALCAGLVMAVAPTLQVRRMLQTRSSRDFSLGYPTLISAGLVLWLAYGISLSNLPMMLSNAASLAFMAATIGVALYFRRAAERDTAPQA